MNQSDCPKAARDMSVLESETVEPYDALDRELQDSFPASDAPSTTVIVRIGSPACSAAPAAESL